MVNNDLDIAIRKYIRDSILTIICGTHHQYKNLNEFVEEKKTQILNDLESNKDILDKIKSEMDIDLKWKHIDEIGNKCVNLFEILKDKNNHYAIEDITYAYYRTLDKLNDEIEEKIEELDETESENSIDLELLDLKTDNIIINI